MSRSRPRFSLPPRGLTAEETGWYLGLGTTQFKKPMILSGIESEKKSTPFVNLVPLVDCQRDVAWTTSEGPGWTIGSLLFVFDDLKPMGVFKLGRLKSNRMEQLNYLAEEELDRSLDSLDLDRDEHCVPTFDCDRGIFSRLAEPFGPLEPQKAVG